MKFSRPASCLLTALTDRHSAPAANVMLPCSATASKASNSRIVGQARFMAASIGHTFQKLNCRKRTCHLSAGLNPDKIQFVGGVNAWLKDLALRSLRNSSPRHQTRIMWRLLRTTGLETFPMLYFSPAASFAVAR